MEVSVPVKTPGVSQGDFIYREIEAIDTMACIMVYGPYENIGTVYESFARWLDAHQQYKMMIPIRQICHKGVADGVIPSQFLTEIQVPITTL